jgi:hypothetical protein
VPLAPLERIRLIGSVLDEVRSPTIPVPHYQLIIAADSGTVLVQERSRETCRRGSIWS